MGGGSPIGMAKAVGFQAQLPIIAIPTTYAGSEMTPVYGITHTDENPPRKVTVNDPKIAPKLVIYDPQLTLDLPARINRFHWHQRAGTLHRSVVFEDTQSAFDSRGNEWYTTYQ